MVIFKGRSLKLFPPLGVNLSSTVQSSLTGTNTKPGFGHLCPFNGKTDLNEE